MRSIFVAEFLRRNIRRKGGPAVISIEWWHLNSGTNMGLSMPLLSEGTIQIWKGGWGTEIQLTFGNPPRKRLPRITQNPKLETRRSGGGGTRIFSCHSFRPGTVNRGKMISLPGSRWLRQALQMTWLFSVRQPSRERREKRRSQI